MSIPTSSNHPTMSNTNQKHSCGSLSELFKFKYARLILMDYDDKRTLKFLRFGEFVVSLIMQASSPIMIITCMVDKLQWPIAKDAPVIRIGSRSFAFAMPGLLYGLQFPPDCKEIDTLERVFMKFAHYKDLNEREAGYPLPDSEPNLWAKLRSRIEEIAHATLARFGHIPGKSPSAVGYQASGLLKIYRMSASTKIIGNAILSGSLKSQHINIDDMRPRLKSDHKDTTITQQAFPSISVFSNLVEAVEVIWSIAFGNSHLLKEKNVNLMELVGVKIWKLNEKGVVAFIEGLAIDENVDHGMPVEKYTMKGN